MQNIAYGVSPKTDRLCYRSMIVFMVKQNRKAPIELLQKAPELEKGKHFDSTLRNLF
jgi:hypothetical protein